MLTQKKVQTIILPLLKDQGKLYGKYKAVLARKAKAGEKVTTVTDDGKETVNTAKEGDFIVKNPTKAEEKYIVPATKFADRYSLDKERDGKRYHSYRPTGKVKAIQAKGEVLDQLNAKDCLKFEAPWGEPMILKEGDYLVCPLDWSEVYRIAKKEFKETYKRIGGRVQ